MVLPKIEDFADPTFDPYIADDLALGRFPDIYDTVAKWRDEGPVLLGTHQEALGIPEQPSAAIFQPHLRVLTYDGVQSVLTQPDLFSNMSFLPTLGAAFGKRSLSVLDAPDHMKYRRVFQKAFLPNVVGQWGEKFVQPVVDQLLGSFRGDGKADLVPQFSRLYPFGVIFRMLGMPEQERPVFQKLMLAQILLSTERERATEATTKLGDYFSALIDERRENPGDDLVSTLVTVEADGDRLPKQSIIDFLRQLFNAGGDTTYRATACLLAAILSRPELLERISADRSLIPKAIEEVFRWEGPVMVVQRVAVRDTEITGVPIPKGALVDVMLGAANRDPAKYENPDDFDPQRVQQARHLAFAQGPHVCLGQHLARVEITRAINSLIDELPNLRLDPDYPPPVILGANLRAPRELRVIFDPS